MPENSPSSLDNLHIASPCHASWDAMSGDDKARFCKTCQKNVFNLSLMTRAEAESLIRAKEGNLCVRFAQREDGTILTQDCPVGFERARRQALRPFRFAAAGIAAVVAALSGLLGIATPASAQPPLDLHRRTTEVKGDAGLPVVSTRFVMGGPPGPAPQTLVKMGDVATKCEAPAQQPPTQQPPALMGKPSMAPMQGALPAPASPPPAVPATTPVTPSRMLMGEPAALHTTPKATVPGKTVAPVKAATKTKKSASKSKRAMR